MANRLASGENISYAQFWDLFAPPASKSDEQPSTTIYLGQSDSMNPESSAQRIGKVWNQLKTSLQREGTDVRPLLEKLGVDARDREAHEMLTPVIQKALGEKVTITPSAQSGVSGVYFLKIEGSIPFAVFKVGQKRTAHELLARKIAVDLNLSKHIVPGLFCSIANPNFSDELIVEELWNGNQKEYSAFGQDEAPYQKWVRDAHEGIDQLPTLTGILEPFVSEADMTLADLANLTVCALCLGLRDVDRTELKGSGACVDAEEIMPPRLLPLAGADFNKTVAATHLPFLETPLASRPIPMDVIKRLKILDPEFNLFRFLMQWSSEKVLYADKNAEDLAVDEDGYDEGGCPIAVEELMTHMEKEVRVVKEKDPILSDRQVDACMMRMTHLKAYLSECLRKGDETTCIKMACAVDPLYKAHREALEASDSSPGYVNGAVGSMSPDRTRTRLSEDQVGVLRSLSRQGNPSPSPTGDHHPSPMGRSVSGNRSMSELDLYRQNV